MKYQGYAYNCKFELRFHFDCMRDAINFFRRNKCSFFFISGYCFPNGIPFLSTIQIIMKMKARV